jgi:hypothetical protein
MIFVYLLSNELIFIKKSYVITNIILCNLTYKLKNYILFLRSY